MRVCLTGIRGRCRPNWSTKSIIPVEYGCCISHKQKFCLALSQSILLELNVLHTYTQLSCPYSSQIRYLSTSISSSCRQSGIPIPLSDQSISYSTFPWSFFTSGAFYVLFLISFSVFCVTDVSLLVFFLFLFSFWIRASWLGVAVIIIYFYR